MHSQTANFRTDLQGIKYVTTAIFDDCNLAGFILEDTTFGYSTVCYRCDWNVIWNLHWTYGYYTSERLYQPRFTKTWDIRVSSKYYIHGAIKIFIEPETGVRIDITRGI